MTNLEQIVENSLFGKVKAGLNRFKHSIITKIAVCSLVGILSAGGLGYGCVGLGYNLKSKNYQSKSIKEPCIDYDGDGYGENCALDDCNDYNKKVHKNIQCNFDGTSCSQMLLHTLCLESCPVPPDEVCDNKDNDCDGLTDEGCYCWKSIRGGIKDDLAASIQQTKDGGYIVAGTISSESTGLFDAWIFKLKPDGNVEWDQILGGSQDDVANSIQQTSDGGFIVAGATYSKGAGEEDAWVLRLNTNGNLLWDKTFGGKGDDWAKSIQQTTDGGYIVAGETSKNADSSNAWVFKLDYKGDILWERVCGNNTQNKVRSIQQTSDEGYIVVGNTGKSLSYCMQGWVFKLEPNGDTRWDKTFIFGEEYNNNTASIQQTTDGGYIVAGYTDGYTHSKKMTMHKDAWILKLESDGDKEWEKLIGKWGEDQATSIRQTSDGGYIVAGFTSAWERIGSGQTWIFKLKPNGDTEWSKSSFGEYYYSDFYPNFPNSISQTTDGGYVIAGWRTSLGVYPEVLSNAWILKLDKDGNSECK